MPLSKLQSDILHLLAAHRDPESYVAGSTPFTANTPRFSADIDIFHDREERVARSVEQDSAVLEEHGFKLQWLRREFTFYSALIRRGDEATKLEWAVDSDFRFFPAQQDELFGYMLHPVDLATNKVMAAAGRREPRDVVDLVMIHEQVLLWRVMGGCRQIAGIYARRGHQRNPPPCPLHGSRLPPCSERSARRSRHDDEAFAAGFGRSRSLCYAYADRQDRVIVSERRQSGAARS